MNSNPRESELAGLIASVDDAFAHHMLWIHHDGSVQISAVPEDLTPVGFAEINKNAIKFRLETFAKGNGYVGVKAAQDQRYIARLYRALDVAWKTNETGYSENF